jgi:excisionase family DNA binding protein
MARRPRAADVRRAGPVMTVDQVAAYLQMNRLTVYRYVREGKIPAAKFGKLYRILKADVDRFLEEHKVPPRPAGRPASPGARIRSVWVRDGKRADDIYVGPSRRERAQDRDPVFLSGDPLAIVMRSLN